VLGFAGFVATLPEVVVFGFFGACLVLGAAGFDGVSSSVFFSMVGVEVDVLGFVGACLELTFVFLVEVDVVVSVAGAVLVIFFVVSQLEKAATNKNAKKTFNNFIPF